jgi:putative RecB family exonuclease
VDVLVDTLIKEKRLFFERLQFHTIKNTLPANGFGHREIVLKFDTLIKTKKPKFEQYYTVRGEIDEKRLIRKIKKVWEGISRGVFIPNDTSWKCPNCHYRQHCDEWFLKGGEL